MKIMLEKIQFHILRLKDRLSALLKTVRVYVKNHPRQSLAIFAGVVMVVSIAILLVLMFRKPKTIIMTPFPFTEITTYKLNAMPSDIDFGKARSALQKAPSNLTVYQTQDKPLTGLQKDEILSQILRTLGFTSSARNYSNKEALSYYEKGRSLTISLIGDKISFSSGLNVEPELLQTGNIYQTIDNLLQTARFFFQENELVPGLGLVNPKTVYSKMGELGLYEINNVEQADVITFIFQPQIDSINIASGPFIPYVSLSKNGKILAFSVANQNLVSATKNPVTSFGELKKSFQNNEVVSLNKIEAKYLNPQSIVIKNTQVLYYYNEKLKLLTPVISLQVILKQDGREKETTLYLPAFADKYYTRIFPI